MHLKGKVCLITGAGSGIGKATASAFAAAGASVIVNDVSLAVAQSVVPEIAPMDGEVLPIEADVSQSIQVQDMFQKILSHFGSIDVLVNNAGVQTETPFLELTEQEWDTITGINLKGAFLCSQSAARVMAKRGHGKIINISSIHQQLPRRNIAHYAASKAGLNMLTKVIALELADCGVTAVCVAPGATATPMNQAELSCQHKLAELSSRIPMARVADPEEIARCIVFLASDVASYITGSTLYVDGGMNLGRLD
ncbi:MAG: glucose 1-dehydrogenase [Chloroflexota bacterium]|nr:glucose 1-dehydrogenase [Chloroflexota bacterium]